MKQETGKKSKKLLLIVIAIVALLAAAAVALVLILGGNNEGANQDETPVAETPASAVYWNLDRVAFTDPETGLSTREKGADGLYAIRFASEGKVIEMKTADKQLINYIDTMDAVGLVLDADGLIIDVLSVKDVAIETAKSFYVKKVDGNTITVNSSIAMNGMDIIVTLTDAASVMDVRADSENLGQTIELDVFDLVSIYSTKDNVVTAVYLHERPESSPLYLRTNRMYDSTTASTTREPDKNGVYTIPFAMGGKVVELKCKDKNLVTGIDSGTDSNEVMGLTFDEEGYITGKIAAATAARGKLVCLVYNVTAINGNQIEATRLLSGNEQGKVVTFNVTDKTEIVMNEIGCNHFIGEYVDSLELYDRVAVWGDMDNNAIYIKIDRRKVQGDDIAMYYLQKRMYDSAKGETSRVPNASGYYVYELAAKGKMVTVKTKDKKLANLLDANTWQFFGLKVQGGIIKEYYDANCISGGYGIGGQRFVTEVMANIVRIVSGTDFNSGGNYMLTDKTEIYNMTGYNGKLGSKTELKIGDRVIANRDVENNITHIYVLDRPTTGTKMYYNASRKYNGTTFETSRVPDAEGYYVYTLYCEGKEVTAKTKDKAIATIVDQQNAPIAALKVNKEGIITAAYPAIAGQKYLSKVFNYNYVGEVTKDKVVSCYYYSNGEKFNASASYPMAKNCKVYNVSTNYTNYRGEKSSVKVGDQIQALRDIQTGELTHIWIMNRAIDSPLYFHVARKALVNNETARVPNAEGYYEVELFADGKIKTYKTKDKAIMTAVDNYGSETFFALKTDGDIILGTGSSSSSKKAANQVVSFRDVTKISGKNITVTRMRPGGTDHLQQTEFKINSKTKVYDICYYSENQFKEVKLEKGDRVSVFADRDGNVSYIFVMYPHTREEGYQSKCSHCNKTVWWEPYCGSFIEAENVHYYYPTDYVRSGQGTVGKDEQTTPGALHYTAVFDLNGRTYSAKARNFLVYSNLVLIDSVGGGVLESTGYQGGNGGNFMVIGGSVEINDGITVRMMNDSNSRAGSGGNFHVSNKILKDGDGKTIKTNVGTVTINDAKLEGWAINAGNFQMNGGTVLNLNGGTVSGGTTELINGASFNWKGGIIEGNLTVNGGTVALEGTPNFSGILMTSNGGKVDISKLSTDARISTLPTGVFTTESDNIDAYLNVFTPAVDSCNIVKDGKALSATISVPSLTENLQFVPGTQMAACAVCEQMVTWTPITQAQYGETRFGNPAIGQHVYLAEDIVHTGDTDSFIGSPTRINETTPGVACFHLNGHNLTATKRNIIHGGYGIVNMFGSGTVSGNGTNGATITINTNIGIGGINLLSGTYTKAEGNATGVVHINSNGGNITIGEKAVIKTDEDVLAVKLAGGALIDSNLKIMGTVEGGYVESVAASKQGANDLDGNPNYIYFVLDGGNLKGGVKLAKDTIIGLGGAAKVGGFGMDLTSGAKIRVSELSGDASVAVAANGVFTENIAVETQKGFYTAAPKYKTIEVVGQTLSTERDPNAAPDLPKDPATPTKPALLSVDNSDLNLDADERALCPVCNETVTWIAITDAPEMIALEGNKHYYLANDITYTGTTAAISYEVYNQKVTCLHLNGHNITATAGWAIYSGGYLNVMGNGIVSGNRTTQYRGATVDINSGAARLNLYGGTYKKSTASTGDFPVVNIHGNGGQVNLYQGATIDATGVESNAAAVRSWCGEFNMYGGQVKGGKGTALTASNWATRADGTGTGTINVFGGEIITTSGAAIYAGGATKDGNTALGHLGIYGGKISGTVSFGVYSETIVGGNPVMNRLYVQKDTKFTLGRLTTGADITVYAAAGQTVTTQSENAQTYLNNYFKAESGKTLIVSNHALAIAGEIPADPKVPALPAKLSVDNSNLVLDGSNQAKCPVCDKVVTWTPITEITGDHLELIGETHYYLANDITWEGTSTAIQYNWSSTYARKTACLHLNGHNLTATKSTAIFAGNYLNIMGNGVVKGNRNENNRAVTLEINSSVALLNVYGGTYLRYDKTNQKDLVRTNNNCTGGIVNIYQGAILGDPVRDTSTRGNTVAVMSGTLNIYGGELHGEYNGGVISLGSYISGDTRIAGILNVYGGLIQAKNGSGLILNGQSAKHTTANIYGGKILGGTSLNSNCDMIIGGTAVMNRLVVADGAKFTLAEMAEGASITLQGTGVVTNQSNNAAAYLTYFHPLSGYNAPTVVNNALSVTKTAA